MKSNQRNKLLSFLMLAASLCASLSAFATNQPNKQPSLNEKFANLESTNGGRLGIAVIDTNNNNHINYRAEEHFPMCSTSKVMGVSAILKKSMSDNALLQQKITYTQKDIDAAAYAPITKKYIKGGMTVSELCAAAITQSDNAAINLLMKQLGGPQAVTAFARNIGDNTFRLDRWEPELNTAIPGDLRDTTTPEAMSNSLQKLAFGNVLGLPQREQLKTWLRNNAVGDKRMRAGTPKGWIIEDKTGTGEYGTTNDIGIIYPPHYKPIIVSIYYTQDKKDATPKDKVIADATRIIVNEYAAADSCIKTKP